VVTGLVVEEKSWEGTNTPAAGWFVEPISRFQFSWLGNMTGTIPIYSHYCHLTWRPDFFLAASTFKHLCWCPLFQPLIFFILSFFLWGYQWVEPGTQKSGDDHDLPAIHLFSWTQEGQEGGFSPGFLALIASPTRNLQTSQRIKLQSHPLCWLIFQTISSTPKWKPWVFLIEQNNLPIFGTLEALVKPGHYECGAGLFCVSWTACQQRSPEICGPQPAHRASVDDPKPWWPWSWQSHRNHHGWVI
jgi:hypothetical protein